MPKNEIIKSLVETQTVILNLLSKSASDKQVTTHSALPNLCENYCHRIIKNNSQNNNKC